MRRLVRISNNIDKLTMFDNVLHWLGVCCLRKSILGHFYCRICGKRFFE